MKAVNLHVWHTGEVLIDQALAFKEKTWHPAPFTGWLRPYSRKMWVPVSAYLIERLKGRILGDTGCMRIFESKEAFGASCPQYLSRQTA
ncbi:hypothetical protein ACFOLF_25035 [Paenibacillus sepulcri]|uniref:hypothetical protein n=1 Tax=Paenibacillus sepulcri TaxID=359917 RepID=UPI0035E79191